MHDKGWVCIFLPVPIDDDHQVEIWNDEQALTEGAALKAGWIGAVTNPPEIA